LALVLAIACICSVSDAATPDANSLAHFTYNVLREHKLLMMPEQRLAQLDAVPLPSVAALSMQRYEEEMINLLDREDVAGSKNNDQKRGLRDQLDRYRFMLENYILDRHTLQRYVGGEDHGDGASSILVSIDNISRFSRTPVELCGDLAHELGHHLYEAVYPELDDYRDEVETIMELDQLTQTEHNSESVEKGRNRNDPRWYDPRMLAITMLHEATASYTQQQFLRAAAKDNAIQNEADRLAKAAFGSAFFREESLAQSHVTQSINRARSTLGMMLFPNLRNAYGTSYVAEAISPQGEKILT